MTCNSEKNANLRLDNYQNTRMELDLLTAISPIDGRYRGKTNALAAYFSEFALIKYRVQVEVEYFHYLVRVAFAAIERCG